MIRVIVILLIFGIASGQVEWWQLPGLYLNAPGPVPTLLYALRHASSYDPVKQGFNFTDLADKCYAVTNDNPFDLDREEQAAITCYTRPDFLSRRVNRALRSLDATLLNAWGPFLKLFHTATNKLNLTKPETVCRGDVLYRYGPHTQGSVVTLPLSFSADLYTCNQFALVDLLGPESNHSCSIAKLIPKSTKILRDYSLIIDEDERTMLPGTIAVVDTIIPGSSLACTQYLLIEIDRSEVSNTTAVTSLIDDSSTPEEIENTDSFLRKYYKPSSTLAVLTPPTVVILIDGGRDNAYNPLPFITNITIQEGVTFNALDVGQLVIAINGNPTRGLTAEEAKKLIADAALNDFTTINYTLSYR